MPLGVTESPFRRCGARGDQLLIGAAVEDLANRLPEAFHGAAFREAIHQRLMHPQQIPGTAIESERHPSVQGWKRDRLSLN